jgi:mannosyltransferase
MGKRMAFRWRDGEAGPVRFWPERGWNKSASVFLVAILIVASVLRFEHLGQSSLWYDEIVTMRLARTESPTALISLLRQIDATRAPLHPLILRGWFKLFGDGDYAARVFSCLCGIITVALVYWVGLRAFDRATGLWAAWLSALSPLLVYYSREVRMYAWLVTVTCLSWGVVFSHGRAPAIRWLVIYALCLIALAYSHPLGLLMAGSLGLATLFDREAFRFSWRAWFVTHLAAGLAVVPWVSQYVDHAPELITGPPSLRFLLGMPIAFIGGNSAVLLVCVLLIGFGLSSLDRREQGGVRVVLERSASFVPILIWLIVPPLSLYVYSLVAHPIFEARYTLFVGPAYLILVARGLGKLPLPVGIAVGAAGAVLSGAMLLSHVYRPDLKADWKAAAAYLNRYDPNALVVVISADPFRNVESESARYYLGPGRVVIPWPDRSGVLNRSPRRVWVSIGVRDGRAVGSIPATLTRNEPAREVVEFPGLRLTRVEPISNQRRQDDRVHGSGGPDR